MSNAVIYNTGRRNNNKIIAPRTCIYGKNNNNKVNNRGRAYTPAAECDKNTEYTLCMRARILKGRVTMFYDKRVYIYIRERQRNKNGVSTFFLS